MIAPILSSMCITAVDGELMGWNIDMLFYFLLFIGSLLVLDAFAFLRVMQQEKMDNAQEDKVNYERSIISEEGNKRSELDN